MPAVTTVTAPKSPGAPLEGDAANGNICFEDVEAFQVYAASLTAKYEETKQLNLKASSVGSAPCWYLYKGCVYDVTPFTNAHPGGSLILLDYHGKDVTQVFHDEYNFHAHTNSALNMLLQYRVGTVRRVESTKKGELGELENYQREELTAYPRMTEQEMIYKDFVIRRDHGLVWQVMFLTLPQYLHMINTPIYVPYCRLFDWGVAEFFSRTKYWVVAMLWLPLSFFWVLRGIFRDYTQLNPAWSSHFDAYLYYPNQNMIFHNYPAPVWPSMAAYLSSNETNPRTIAEAQFAHAAQVSRFNPMAVVALFLFGVALWTLMEYFVHRVIFHFERAIPAALFDNPLCKLLHLVLHGIHHIIPMDPDRLVFPPALFVIVSTILYIPFERVMTGSCLDIMAGGVVCGYVLYDEIHYFIHHLDPTDFYFKDLKKYHHAHHYVDDTRGYGISNKFWDIVFGTACKKN